MMGCGKTTLGRSVAKQLNWEHVDLDTEVVRRIGLPIRQIFAERGEAGFRAIETETLRALPESDRIVLSVGGGAPTREENWPPMRRVGPIVYLKASEALLARRLARARSERPLLQGENWRERLGALLREREAFYLRADCVIPLDGKRRAEVVRQLCEIALEGRR
jgi:shikimate kinase